MRGGQLFGEQTTMAMTKKYFKGLQGVENIYTQHKPYLIDVLQVFQKLSLSVTMLTATDVKKTAAIYQQNHGHLW